MFSSATTLAGVAIVGFLVPVTFAGDCDEKTTPQNTSFIAAAHDAVPSIFEIAFTTPDFSTLAGLIAVADLDEPLNQSGDFTVFAPTNDAFEALPDGTLTEVINDKDLLTKILTYHVVPGRIFADDIPQGRTEVETLGGEILIIDRAGADIRINGNQVVAADIEASNGVGHVIEGVLLPGKEKPKNTLDLFDVLERTSELSTLETAVKASGFARSLGNDGPYTVFTPTNDAFAALPSGTVESLLDHSNVNDLRAVLRLHILAGEVDARGAVVAGEAESREGSTLRFEIEDGQLFVVGPTNRAKVIKTNITAENGIAHVIDTVLLPGDSH
ncbi:MAG: fasciclin domain-containing protein [Planctomycetota bacterium]